MSHHFGSTWSAHQQKQHHCAHKDADVGNLALIWSARLPWFDSQRDEISVWWVYCGSYPALCYLRCYLVMSAALDHFLPIVTRPDYLSVQVITVHLLPPLPVSDHRRAAPSPLLSACRWRWDQPPRSGA